MVVVRNEARSVATRYTQDAAPSVLFNCTRDIMLKAWFRAADKQTEQPLPELVNAETLTVLKTAEEALRNGKISEAIDLLERLLQKQHDCARAHFLLGDAHKANGDIEDARDCYVLADCFDASSSLPLLRLGLLAFDEQNWEAVVSALTKAVKRGVQTGATHNVLGAAHYELGHMDDALYHLKLAVSLQPDLAQAHSNLGLILFRELEQFDAGASHLETALRLQPNHSAILCNWILVLKHQGRTAEALALCDDLLKRDPTLSEASFSRGLILLGQKQYSAGWADYELRKIVRSNYERRELPWPQWRGTSLEGKTIYVHLEQGLGDEIMFASCLPDIIARAGKCICESSPKLQKLFRQSFPGAVVVEKDGWRAPGFSSLHVPEVHAAIGSLPRFLRNSVEDFPMHQGYLRAESERISYWQNKLAALPGKKKIGISWRGGSKSTRASLRSIQLKEWLPVLSLPGYDFVSLQYGDCAEELAELDRMGLHIEHWHDSIDDYAETGALVSALDMVISVQTAVVHLAGALGRPVWALISAVPEWRYGGAGERMPWYPTARLIRQTELDQWSSVMERLATELS